MTLTSCDQSKKQNEQKQYELIVLDPAHFHAALVQKSMYPEIDSNVKVFAPEGQGIKNYLGLVKEYNDRSENPTDWDEEVYTGSDYLEKMLQQKHGHNNIVVLAGNNKKKINYISESVNAGLNVFSDKPLVIDSKGFKQLKAAFDTADKKDVLLYDIMTQRYEITNLLQKAFSELPDVFGELKQGTEKDPSVIFESVHHFYKQVSGKPLIRPDWYFDVNQQGEGIVDVTTHMIDLAQWECFPKTVLDYKKDVQILSARHWPTLLSPEQFSKVTGENAFPDFLQPYVKDDTLHVYANGEMNYALKGTHVRVTAIWKYEAPKGGGDTYHAELKGTKANLIIRQGKEQDYLPILYIEPTAKDKGWEESLQKGMDKIKGQYPGVALEQADDRWKVIIPQKYNSGHEQHFALVLKKYLQYLQQDNMPEWEKSFMLTKYFITTKALEVAKSQ